MLTSERKKQIKTFVFFLWKILIMVNFVRLINQVIPQLTIIKNFYDSGIVLKTLHSLLYYNIIYITAHELGNILHTVYTWQTFTTKVRDPWLAALPCCWSWLLTQLASCLHPRSYFFASCQFSINKDRFASTMWWYVTKHNFSSTFWISPQFELRYT